MGSIMGGLTVNKTKAGKATTTNNTATDIVSIPLPAGYQIKITAKVSAIKSDDTVRASWDLGALFYRETGGDVTIEGNMTENDSHQTAGNVYTAELVANTTTQCAVVRCTGATSNTVAWKVHVDYTITG